MAPGPIHTALIAANQPESSPGLSLPSPSRKRCNGKQKLACSVDPFKSDSRRECGNALLLPNSEDGTRGSWSVFPSDINDYILAKLDCNHLFQAKRISKSFKDRIESDGFHGCRGKMRVREGLFTALYFFVRDSGVWQCAGYDLSAKTWRRLPPFGMLPRLDPALFKDHSICGAGGIMCANVSSSSSTHEKMMVFNPLTGRWRELPPLNHRRNPVLMQMVVDSAGDWYKIVVAGSARAGHEHLSKITEVFDSRTSMWTVTQDLPGPLFALNEHQTGVYVNGILYCIAFLEEDSGKGLLAYNVDEGKWLPHLACPLPNSTNLNIVQLVESNGAVVVFSEVQQNLYNQNVEHRIDLLEKVVCTKSAQGTGKWRNVMTETKVGNQAGLQTYPEYTCVPFGEEKVCIFNTIVHTGIVYDVRSGKRVETLSSPPCSGSGDMGFYSMNPLTFCFEPSFKGNPKISPVDKICL